MKKIAGVILLAMLCLGGCSDDDDDVASSVTGASSTTTATTQTTTPAATDADKDTTKKETGKYFGRYNGDRPTWYYGKKMSGYPKTFYLTISGCVSNVKVSNNGKRWTGSGLVVKQSEVSGRGMAVLAPSSCKSKSSYLTY